MFFIPEWLSSWWTTTPDSDAPDSSESIDTSVKPAAPKSKIRRVPAKLDEQPPPPPPPKRDASPARKPAKAKAAAPKKGLVKLERRPHRSTVPRVLRYTELAGTPLDTVSLEESNAEYDWMVERMKEIVSDQELLPMLNHLSRTFATTDKMTAFLTSDGPESMLARMFPIYCKHSATCPVLFRPFMPIVAGISRLLPTGSVKFHYVERGGRKKCRLEFKSRQARTMWFAQMFDLIQNATDIALASSLERPSELPVAEASLDKAVKAEPTPEESRERSQTPPLPDPDHPLAESLKEMSKALD